MDTCSLVLILASVFSCLFLNFPSQTEAHLRAPGDLMKMLDKACRQGNADFSFCLRSLASDSRTSAAHDVKGLAEVALDIARKKSVKVAESFDSLFNCKSTNRAFKAALQQCAKSFRDAVGFLNLKGLEGDTAGLDVHYAQDSADECGTALANANVEIASIPALIQQWRQFYQTAYSTVLVCEENASNGNQFPLVMYCTSCFMSFLRNRMGRIRDV